MSNTPEYLVDQVQNVNVQGPLVTVTYGRTAPGPDDKASDLLEKLQVTMTTPNFVNTVNALNQIVKRMSEKNKAPQKDSAEQVIEAESETRSDDKSDDKTSDK
jgi:hypothetical protein